MASERLPREGLGEQVGCVLGGRPLDQNQRAVFLCFSDHCVSGGNPFRFLAHFLAARAVNKHLGVCADRRRGSLGGAEFPVEQPHADDVFGRPRGLEQFCGA